MILNPSHIFILLKGYRDIVRLGVEGDTLADMLAVLFRKLLGTPSYDTFLATYQLYLQSIPLETAKAAWGLNAAGESRKS